MRTRLSALSAIMLLVLGATALAASNTNYRQIEGGKSITPNPDKAYLLMRAVVHSTWSRVPGRIFVRVLTPEELKAPPERSDPDSRTMEPNVVFLDGDAEYSSEGDDWLYLLEVKPGDYILMLCLGTVRFQAKAGMITDLGYINYGPSPDWPSTLPEDGGPHRTFSVRPYEEGMVGPGALANLSRLPADYRAVGFLPNYLHAMMDRVEPVPGVLDYDKDGNIVDLKAAKNAPSQHN